MIRVRSSMIDTTNYTVHLNEYIYIYSIDHLKASLKVLVIVNMFKNIKGHFPFFHLLHHFPPFHLQTLDKKK